MVPISISKHIQTISIARDVRNVHTEKLIKTMMVVTTTGNFIKALGPYLADNKNNDIKIKGG